MSHASLGLSLVAAFLVFVFAAKAFGVALVLHALGGMVYALTIGDGLGMAMCGAKLLLAITFLNWISAATKTKTKARRVK